MPIGACHTVVCSRLSQGALIVIVAEIDFVGSLTDVAVTVTEPFGGNVGGAV